MSSSKSKRVVVLLAFAILGSAAGFLCGRPQANRAQAAPAKAKDNGRPAGEDQEFSRAFELRDSLARVVDYGGLEDKNTKLVEALDQLAKAYNLTFDVNDKAFKAAGVDNVLETAVGDPPIPPMKASLDTIVRKILTRVTVPDDSPVYLIRKHHIEITTEAAVRAELHIPKGRPLLPLVYQDFREASLAHALRTIADASIYNVVLDPAAADKAKTQVTARLFNVPVDTAVRLLADMEGLESVRLDNVFYVTTPEKAARLRAEQKDQCLGGKPPPGVGPAKKQ